MEKNCLNCDQRIIVKPSHFERKKYCSRKCKSEYQKKNPINQHLSQKKYVDCNFCKKKLLRKPSNIFKTNFCSHSCKAKYQEINKSHFSHLKKRVKLRCEECKNEFYLTPYRAKTAKYCSNNCSYKAISRNAKVKFSKKRKVNCALCNQEFYKKQSVIKKLNFCSENCMGIYYSESGIFAGSKSGTWQGGDINYYGPNWRRQRREARKRDNFTCQDCGINEVTLGQELSVHHIIPFRQFNGDWKRANRLSNLVSLCEYPCHRKRHSNKKLVDDIV
ncbi:HNH endonuclease [Fictibacillus fluitans]|uniref:HNH nuclease domain-containing protein n=1 Tax=Fictibacillus fluitans TaxID=3058422 RepID=A0ABT8HWX8_9BACL|nr:hypothetical protein [Fictibacillus sp. NE201]MDN4525288.1 hypothetical protein [Fictibacillus sp. NE201]